jgi:diguanylate cyclase (GGDEF)-like protein/PAS domain S-box-containing protein
MRFPFKINLTIKFIGYLVLLTVIPLLVVGLISLRVSTQILTEESSVFTLELVKNQREYLDLQLEQVESLIANISGVEEITNALLDVENSDTYTNLATQAQIGYILNGYLNLRGLLSIEIFTLEGNHYHVGDTLNVDNIRGDVKDRIFEETLASNQNVLWTGIEDNVNVNSAHRKVLTAAKILRRTDRETFQQFPVGLLLVNYSVADIYDRFSQINLGSGAYLMVIDAKGRIIYHPDNTVLGGKVSQAFLDKLNNDTGTLTTAVDGKEMFITHARSSKSNWQVVSLIPANTFTAKTGLIRTITFSLLIICFCFAGLAAMLVSRNIVNPIRRITEQFRRFQEGTLDFKTRLNSNWDDEVGELVVWFNSFVESLAARQESDQRLGESEERYALAVSGANDGLWDWDLGKNEIYLSPRWKQILGHQENEIGNSPDEWFGRIHPDCRAEVEAKLGAHLQRKTPHFESEHRLRHKDHTYRWVLARGLAIFHNDGRAYRMAGSHSEITIRKQAEEKLRHDAFYDSLTGLPNRALFSERLKRAILRNQRNPSAQFAILFLDLDQFKLVNDSLGHNFGDILLQEVGIRLQESMRATDTIARLGGDEFGILMEDFKDIRNVTQTADRIQNMLSKPINLNSNDMITSASIGIMMNSPEYNSPGEYLRDADTAMYRAKARGKARYEIFDQTMRDQILLRIKLETDLRRAIDRQELELYYQPIVHLKNQKILGFEGLLRWPHPEKGFISPEIFIPIAEETGLILQLGNWVMQEAAKQLVIWQSEFPYLSKLQMNVNLSGKQLIHPELINQIKWVVNQNCVKPGRLNMEVTESDIIYETETAIAVLNQIKDLGVKIQMDDFGTGYSSLSYLHQFPFDVIKIDRSFIMGMTQDPSKISLVRTIILMANELRKETVAEGIETLEELKILADLGCNYGQGFFISKAINAAAATAFLREKIIE